MMTVDTDLDTRRREAAAWFARLNQRKVSTEDITAFSAWRRTRANAEAFDRVQILWDAAETLAQDADVAALARDAKARATASRRARTRLASVLRPLGAALALAAALGGALWWQGRPALYETAVGGRQSVVLADGSRVTLDTASRIKVRLTSDRRSVELVTGQAFFDVRGDADRPFVVRAGQAQVTALGTRFDVRRVGDGAKVVLVEGRVVVSPAPGAPARWRLRPGEQIVTVAAEPAVAPADVATATSWTQGRLRFERTSIAAAIAEVNRYSETKVVLEAPEIADVPVSGAFDAGATDAFVAALTELYPLDAERREGRIVLVRRPASKRLENNS